MKLLLVAGARPNFMKIASIIDAIDLHNRRKRNARQRFEYLVVHTGQHYDEKMSGAFFKELGLPRPAIDLEVGSGSHAVQTAEIMKRFEPVLEKERPDAVVLVGDVNSTVACALVASKAVYRSDGASNKTGPLIIHVEAGLRSRDRAMPEETNRVLTDALADVLFVTEEDAVHNLLHEGIPRSRIHHVGNTMVDTLLQHRARAAHSPVLQRLGLQSNGNATVEIVRPTPGKTASDVVVPYGVVTLHRPSNVDDPAVFGGILEALLMLSRRLPLFFPIHPRSFARMNEFGLGSQCKMLDAQEPVTDIKTGLYCIEPLSYLDFLRLMSKARIVLTDSGGIQEETTVLGVPCVTIRENTERPVTVTEGTNVLSGTSPRRIVSTALKKLRQPVRCKRPKLWDGKAGERIVSILRHEHQ
jgi:UDP-N-acetylglucosamine 2-epimerase (non-hydrolysing)